MANNQDWQGSSGAMPPTYGQAIGNSLSMLPALLNLAMQYTPGPVANRMAGAVMDTPSNQSPAVNVAKAAVNPLANMHQNELVKAYQKQARTTAEQVAKTTKPSEGLAHAADADAQLGLNQPDPQNPPPQQSQGQPQQQAPQGGGFNPIEILGNLLGKTQGGFNAQTGNMQVPGLFGGLLTSNPEMLNAMNQFRAGNPNLQLAMKKAERQLPMTPYEQSQVDIQQAGLAGTAYTNQVKTLQDSITAAKENEKNILDSLKLSANDFRGPYAKFFGKDTSDTAAGKIAYNKAVDYRKTLEAAFSRASKNVPNLKGQSQQSEGGHPMVGQQFNGETILSVKLKKGS